MNTLHRLQHVRMKGRGMLAATWLFAIVCLVIGAAWIWWLAAHDHVRFFDI